MLAAALVVAAIVGDVVVFAEIGSGTPLTAPATLSPTGAPSSDTEPDRPALGAAAVASDAFEDWSQSGTDPRVQFLASDRAYQGSFSMQVVHPESVGPTPDSALAQEFAVTAAAPLVLSFWVRADDAGAGAVVAQLGTSARHSVAIPAGTYGWRQVSLTYQVPKGVHELSVRLIAAGPSRGVWIDQVAAQGTGSTGVVVQNGGFETNSADLSVTNTSLVFPVGTARIQLVTRRQAAAHATWKLVNDLGDTVLTGSTTFHDSTARVKMPSAPPGYYTWRVTAHLGSEVVDRSLDLVVERPVPALKVGEQRAYGVGVHLGGDTEAQMDRVLGDLRAIGIRTVRTDASWGSIERTRGQYDFSSLDAQVAAMTRAGITPLLIPDYANRLYDDDRTPSSPAGIAAYARFAAALAVRYPTADIDVYNEFDFRFNDGACGKTPGCYLRLLTPTTTAIRDAVRATGRQTSHPTIAAPSITGDGVNTSWLAGFIDGGGLAETDVLALHPYTQPAGPEMLGSELDALRSMTRRASPDRRVPVWFTEIGWSTVPGWVTDQEQAADIARLAAVAVMHGIGRVYLYDAIDDSPLPLDLESNFGLFRVPSAFAPRTAIPKPAAAAEAVSARLLADARLVRTDHIANSNLYAESFTGESGAVQMLWTVSGSLHVVVQGSGLRTTTATGTESNGSTSELHLAVGESPVYVTGHVTAVVRGG